MSFLLHGGLLYHPEILVPIKVVQNHFYYTILCLDKWNPSGCHARVDFGLGHLREQNILWAKRDYVQPLFNCDDDTPPDVCVFDSIFHDKKVNTITNVACY